PEDTVSDLVSFAVVDLLEVVEVQHEQGDCRIARHRQSHLQITTNVASVNQDPGLIQYSVRVQFRPQSRETEPTLVRKLQADWKLTLKYSNQCRDVRSPGMPLRICLQT